MKKLFEDLDKKRKETFKNLDKKRKQALEKNTDNKEPSTKAVLVVCFSVFSLGMLILWGIAFLEGDTTSTPTPEPQAIVSSTQVETSEESSSSSLSSSSTATSSTSSITDTTADDFYRMQNENTLEVGKTYKFTGKLIDKDSWGYDGEGTYSIYVDAYDSKRGRNEPLILDGTTTIASNIKHANEAEFTVTVSEDSYGDYIFKVVSAQTK